MLLASLTLKNNLMSVSDLIKNKLYERAKTVMEKAYAPYSKFKVGAAILDEKNKRSGRSKSKNNFTSG